MTCFYISNDYCYSEILKLQPKTFKFKRLFKRRQLRICKTQTFFKWGSVGLLILRPVQLSASRLSKFKLFLKRAVRKFDKTNRFLWFNSFPHLPLTKKAANARMGKGKGKLKSWYTNIRGGVVLFEFLNVRFGRAFYFIKQIIFRLGISAIAVEKFRTKTSLPLLKAKQVTIKSNWQ